MTDTERAQLIDFLKELRGFFQTLITAIYLPRWLLKPARDALVELDEAKRFEQLVDAVGGGTYDSALVDHGLSGAQLRFKLSLFNAALAEHERASKGPRGWLRRGRRRMARKVLEAANVLLGSIGAAVPIPGAGAIEELKKALESALTFWRRRRAATLPAFEPMEEGA